MKTIRCIVCRSEFSPEELVNATGCPTCGTLSLPSYISQDHTVKINWHELRILTIWADNWARHMGDPQSEKLISAIVQGLEAQKPDGWPALTVVGELEQLIHHPDIQGNIELHQSEVITKVIKKPESN